MKSIAYEGTSQSYPIYLKKYHYSQRTIKAHELRIKRFKTWLKHHKIPRQSSYTNLLQYAKYLQTEKQYNRASTNNELRAIKLYYDYQIEKGNQVENPAEGMAIRGKHIKVLNNLLSQEELEDLYYSYEISHSDTFFKATKQRDKIVLGMLVFQGITAIEIYHLQDEYLKIEKGKIEIPSTRRSNRRILRLQPLQIIDLLNYTQTTKQYLSKKIKTHNDEQLIFGSIHQIRTITNRIIKTLKKIQS
jgi:integrase/recombinase XerD